MLPVVDQISAGGVIFRRQGAGVEVALIRVGKHHRWQLPKGTIEPGETEQEAARREVAEETGLIGNLVDRLESIEYWYVGEQQGKRVRFHKRVHFFLFQYERGETHDHDDEVEEARWMAIDEALASLAFDNDRSVLRLAKEKIAALKG